MESAIDRWNVLVIYSRHFMRNGFLEIFVLYSTSSLSIRKRFCRLARKVGMNGGREFIQCNKMHRLAVRKQVCANKEVGGKGLLCGLWSTNSTPKSCNDGARTVVRFVILLVVDQSPEFLDRRALPQ